MRLKDGVSPTRVPVGGPYPLGWPEMWVVADTKALVHAMSPLSWAVSDVNYTGAPCI